jgi:hypothetical protein
MLSTLQAVRRFSGPLAACPPEVLAHLDLGSAMINRPISSLYPISRWLRFLGQDLGAAYIHQVVPRSGGDYAQGIPLSRGNVTGPMINYLGLLATLDLPLNTPAILYAQAHHPAVSCQVV